MFESKFDDGAGRLTREGSQWQICGESRRVGGGLWSAENGSVENESWKEGAGNKEVRTWEMPWVLLTRVYIDRTLV